MTEQTTVRPKPCPSCPYRRDVPSGIWSPGEYVKLTQYDGDFGAQAAAGATAVFMCHQGSGELCAGWCGCHDMFGTLAARINASQLDPAVWDYVSPVPLFGSGAEAAAHGLRDIASPSPRAAAAIHKIERVRAARGHPVRPDLPTRITFASTGQGTADIIAHEPGANPGTVGTVKAISGGFWEADLWRAHPSLGPQGPEPGRGPMEYGQQALKELLEQSIAAEGPWWM